VAHYYCELAEQAKTSDDLGTAEEMLSKAIKRKPDSVRAQLMTADLLQEAGEHATVIPMYARVIHQDPRLASEVIPRIARSCREAGGERELSSILSELIAEHTSARDAIALAAIRDEQIQNPVALDCVQHFAVGHPILGALIDIDHLTHEDPAVRAATMARIRTALGRIAAQSSRYSCTKCGYATMQLLWQCPSCREWETVVPNQQLALAAVLR
jgi:lipopolysaccharide biosynthesis regulator YciM